MEVFIVCGIALLGVAILIGYGFGGKGTVLRDELKQDYPAGKIHVSREDGSYMVVDFSQSILALGLNRTRGSLLVLEHPYQAEIGFPRILKAEVLRDGIQMAMSSRSPHNPDAMDDTVALGTVGGPLGQLSGAQVKRLSIRITVDDTEQPIHDVTFYHRENKAPHARGAVEFERAAQRMAGFATDLETAMHMAQSVTRSAAPAAGTSMAEQLGKLWSLKEAGALSDAEFETEKDRLISS